MNNDLQAIMARRRRLAEGGSDDAQGKKPPPPPPPPPPASKDNLQEIMARRRRLADGGTDDDDEDEDNEIGLEDLEKDRQATAATPSYSSSMVGSQNFDLAAHSSKGDNLQAIMERRRRLADGEASPPLSPARASPTRPSSFPISPMHSLPAHRRGSATSNSLAYVPQGLSSPTRNASPYLSSPRRLPEGEKPSAVASPVKKDLKSFSMSNDLKAIMDRRRKLASGEIDDEDEDPPMAVQDEDPPMDVPSTESLDTAEKASDLDGNDAAAEQQPPASVPDLNKESNHSSPELDITSTHTHLKQSVHEKEPIIDVEESSDDSSDEERKIPMPVREERTAKTPRPPASRRGQDELGSSSHSKQGRSSNRGKSRRSPSDKVDSRKGTGSSLLDTGSKRSSDEDGASRKSSTTDKSSGQKSGQKKKESMFDSDSDSDSSSLGEPNKRIQTALDSPAAAVMGAASDEGGRDDDADLDEVEIFAAALEQERPAGKSSRSSKSEHSVGEASDVVAALPETDLKEKLASGRKKSERRSAEEISVDPSVDSRNSAGSGGSGGVGRRPKGRRSSSNDALAKKGTNTSGEGRRRSTTAPSSDDRRKKPPKGPRSSNLERSRSDESRSSTEGGRTTRRRSFESEPERERTRSIPQDNDDVTRSSQDSGGEIAAPVFPVKDSTTNTKEDKEKDRASDAFSGGDWGGFPAFGGSGVVNNSGMPSTSEHSELPDAFAGAGTFPATPGDGFPSSSDAFSAGFMADFGDPAPFPTSSGNEEKVDATNNAFGGFSDAFGAFDGASAFPVSGPDAFEKDNFSTPAKKEDISYDSSPLSGVPSRSLPVPTIVQTTVMKGHFQASISTNALSGNLIMCIETGNGMILREVDPLRHYLQVVAVPLLSDELQRKVASKFNLTAYSIESVIRLTSGLHYERGQTRLRVGVIMDLRVLEAPQPLRLVAVWLWGQGGTHPVSILYALSPPSGGDFAYDATTLRMADNLIFLAGTSPKGPCVFVSKPAVRESWTANSLPGTGKVSAMEVTPHVDRTQPFLAIGLTDRSVSVWTYKEAVEGTTKKGKDSGPKRWLFPLCRLESTKTLSGIDATSLNPTGSNTGIDSKNSGHCTHFAWLPKRHSMSSLTLLAAIFQNGLAVYHIALPVVNDGKGGKPLPEPSSSTAMSQTPRLWPMVAKRWQGKHERSFGSWVDLGPHTNPSLCMLLHAHDSSSARIVFGIVNVPSHRRGLMPKEKLLPFRILAAKVVPSSSESFPQSVVLRHDLGALMCYSQARLFSVSLLTDAANGSVRSLFFPVSSQPTGVSSLGENHLPESVSDNDGILHIFSLEHCERNKPDGDLMEWSRPSRRFWLCRTVAGDNKECALEESKEEKTSSSFGDIEYEKGGAVSDTICEIFDDRLIGLVPLRITRCQGANVCAILYRPSLCSKTGFKDGMSMDAVAIAVVDYSKPAPLIEVLEGRDISFWSLDNNGTPRGTILTKGGLSLVFFAWDNEVGACEFGASYRPLLGVEDDDNYVECRRVYCYSGASKVGVVTIGTKLRDNRTCIVAGDLCPESDLSSDDWLRLLPNVVTGRVCWLKPNEEVFSIVGLEGDDSGYRNFSLSTSERVIVLSSAMEISAESRASVASPALAPLGAFAVAFFSEGKFCYTCCLDGDLLSGTVASLPFGGRCSQHSCLLSVRPDRIIVANWHHAVRLVENGQRVDSFVLPAADTRPVLLLEPMVANAVCVGGKQEHSTQVLRIIIEKFGRKSASLTHGEDEGIGNKGTGISAKTFAILDRYKLQEAKAWLLTGITKFDRAANTTILPPWMPAAAKSSGAPGSNAFLHVIAAGDQYLSDYVKAPGSGAVASLPRRSDPSTYTVVEKAEEYVRSGRAVDAIKTLDFGGSEQSESLLVQLALLLGRDSSSDTTGIVQSISGLGQSGLSSSNMPMKLPSSLAALALSLKQSRSRGQDPRMVPEHITKWMIPIAPSLQKGSRLGRFRTSLLDEHVLESAGDVKENFTETIWATACNETKHVWNEGPKKEKDKLLLLDRVDDWLGRRRPVIVGKEGATAARDGGEKILADLLNMDDNSFGGKSDLESEKDGWVEGVGEGRSDEANLSAYFRMSEGEEEDNPWRSEGMLDISPYQNKGIVYGDTEKFSLKPSTSSVDEGEEGKVKALFDLVFENTSIGAFALAATRGCSLDIGVLHSEDRQSRQRCTLEFWYFLPQTLKHDMVLARRTFGPDADNLSKTTVVSDRDSVLWEVVLRRKGSLEFRTCGGSKLDSFKKDAEPSEGDRADLVQFGKWNHVCLILSSKDSESITGCSATILMKGVPVMESRVSMLPSGFDEDDLDSSSTLNDLLQKSHLLLGLNNPEGFRITEFRVWACARSEDDVKAMMYEYLNAAESKKKFKVKIKNKGKSGGLTLGKGGLLAPKSGAAGEKSAMAPKMTLSLAPKISLAPPPKEDIPEEESRATAQAGSGFDVAFDAFGNNPAAQPGAPEGDLDIEPPIEEEPPTSLWDTAVPLSQQVRSSAAAALIRGPPATRHFGGNRGGLPDFSGMERYGVGGIAICGSEKTIVFRDNEDPPALTYPIGASGAVVSDQMDDEGSEFLCCFLARDRRMVVFELQSRTVVVELQMTTKLNFWRFLPPEAGENTLCFMLVTPVGGFHWMPLDESPRPHQVWKRGPDLQGKKVVSYEEGGSNGADGPDILSTVGLIMVTKASAGGTLEAWIVPIGGDSVAKQVSDDVMGTCLCLPPDADDGPFLPLLIAVLEVGDGIYVNVMSLFAGKRGSVELGEVAVTIDVDIAGFEDVEYEAPVLAMGTYPAAICCSLANIVVIIIRSKGLVVAYELEDGDMSLIAREGVGHYVIDAVMRYSEEVGGAEIVMLLSDTENPKDGRIVSFCFRSAD